jgi:hypothetical protein
MSGKKTLSGVTPCYIQKIDTKNNRWYFVAQLVNKMIKLTIKAGVKSG